MRLDELLPVYINHATQLEEQPRFIAAHL